MQCPSKCPVCQQQCGGVVVHEPPFHGCSLHLWIMQGHENEVRIKAARFGDSILKNMHLPEVIGYHEGAYLYWHRKEDTFDSAIEWAAKQIDAEAKYNEFDGKMHFILIQLAGKIRNAKQGPGTMDYCPVVGVAAPTLPPVLENLSIAIPRTDDELNELLTDHDLGISE